MMYRVFQNKMVEINHAVLTKWAARDLGHHGAHAVTVDGCSVNVMLVQFLEIRRKLSQESGPSHDNDRSMIIVRNSGREYRLPLL
jgi:hypothetical protein